MHTSSPGTLAPPTQPAHALAAAEVLATLDTARRGLTAEEAARRLRLYGPNRLQPARPTSALRILATQLESIVVLLLIAAALLSLLSGDRLEAIAIAAVLVINTAVGFATELRARRAMEALLRLDASHASVIRDGSLRVVPAEAIVPGDIVRLDAGERVPVDGRLFEAIDLRIDEASLTGESLPVSKQVAAPLATDTPLADRVTMVYKSTIVASGTGLVVATATGRSTEIGRVGALVATVEERRTPLEVRLDRLGRQLAWAAVAVAVLVAGLAAAQGASLDFVLHLGIALAVAAVPEALPAVATIALAVGVHRMARRQALVRRLASVETLGSTTVVCTDKTRTLTTGAMTAVRFATLGLDVRLHTPGVIVGDHVRHGLLAAALASRPQPMTADGAIRGDPVDRAMFAAAADAGVMADAAATQSRLVGLVPFSSEHKLMAAFYDSGHQTVVYAKGSPRQILERSTTIADSQGVRPLDEALRDQLRALNDHLAGAGLRVLAVAQGQSGTATLAGVRELSFLGFVGLADPPAPGVAATIATLRRAGLRTLMLTGDQRATAEAIGRELGLVDAQHRILDARALDRLSESELQAKLPELSGFSRITPEHKLRLVRVLQSRGEIVAMLGDGVNDAPALRQADVGVAMGLRGTDVAKESASIILGDDRFETVAAAVEEGRTIFENIRKFVFYLFSCNVGEILVLLATSIAGWPVPLLPIQILWLNLVTDTFPALALALEPGDEDAMLHPPRDPDEALLSRPFIGRIVFYAALIAASTVAAYAAALSGPQDKARTIAFMTLALAQVFHLGNARSDAPVVRPSRALANRYALAAVGLGVVVQVIAVSVDPLRDVLGLVSLDADDWLLVLAASGVTGIVGQAVKTATAFLGRRRRH